MTFNLGVQLSSCMTRQYLTNGSYSTRSLNYDHSMTEAIFMKKDQHFILGIGVVSRVVRKLNILRF